MDLLDYIYTVLMTNWYRTPICCLQYVTYEIRIIFYFE